MNLKLVGNANNKKAKQGAHSSGRASTAVAEKKRGGRKGRVFLTVLLCAVLMVGCAAAAYFIWERPPEHAPNGVTTPEPTPTEKAESGVPTPTPAPENAHDGDVYTFVVAGKDEVGANTDTIILGSMNVREHTVDAVSIPRDTLVNTPGSVKKINALYGYSLNAGEDGVTGLKDGIRDLVGFDVDFYAVINIQAFEKLVDTIGGVYYDVPIDMYYDDPTQNLHIAIPKGYQKLDGANALHVVRFRMGNGGSGYPNGDIGRIATQQDFLKSVAVQFIEAGSIQNLAAAADIFAENVKTDLTAANISYFARQLLLCSGDNISFHTLPGNYEDSIGGFSYVSLDLPAWLEMVNEYISPWSEDITEENVNILTHEKGVFRSTTGVVEGGEGSFLTVEQYSAAVKAEQESE